MIGALKHRHVLRVQERSGGLFQRIAGAVDNLVAATCPEDPQSGRHTIVSAPVGLVRDERLIDHVERIGQHRAPDRTGLLAIDLQMVSAFEIAIAGTRTMDVVGRTKASHAWKTPIMAFIRDRRCRCDAM